MKKLISLILVLVLCNIGCCTGQNVFQKTLSTGSSSEARDIKMTSDGGQIICGTTGGGVLLLKLDQNGNKIWSKRYQGLAGSIGRSVEQTSDGGYIVAGSWNDGGATTKMLLFKTDPSGNIQWQKTFGGAWYEYGYSAKETPDGGFIIVGCTKSFGSIFGTNFDVVYLVKTDQNGNIHHEEHKEA